MSENQRFALAVNAGIDIAKALGIDPSQCTEIHLHYVVGEVVTAEVSTIVRTEQSDEVAKVLSAYYLTPVSEATPGEAVA